MKRKSAPRPSSMYEDEKSCELDNFKKKFKYYKSKKPKPSLEDVIDTENLKYNKNVSPVNIQVKEDHRTKILGLNEMSSWEDYSFVNHKGLFIIKNPFTSLGQRYWIRRCLEDYPKKPNKLNIDLEINVRDWWSECHIDNTCNAALLKKLRWTTFGYHHNWDDKVYRENNKSVFPVDLAELCDVVSNYMGYTKFSAQAAIVNYYHMDSTLSAHTDHSEVNLEAPLFSFSFGQSAIFLIGGRDKSEEPTAIKINSGDVVIMSKEARLCYHAVPKILKNTNNPWETELKSIDTTENQIKLKYVQDNNLVSLINNNLQDSNWEKFRDYVSESRINMNVRQVLYDDQTILDCL